MTMVRKAHTADHHGPHSLLIYIEPTPYILGLVRELNKEAEKPVKTLFLCQDLTQSWGLSIEGYNSELLMKGYLMALKQIWQRLAAKPVVLHLAGWGHPLLLFALLTAGILRVPVVMESDTQLPVGLPVWKRIVKRIIYPLVFRIPKMMLPGGSRQAKYFKHYGVNDNRIKITNMTVDVSAIKQRCAQMGEDGRKETRNRLNLDKNSVVFVFVGRLVAHKGLSDLLVAFKKINHEQPNARLLIVGDGPLRESLSRTVKMNQAVQSLGRLDMDGVIEIYHAADVAVVPSHFEPWGLVVNEALAAGLPVVASDRVGSVDDLIEDGVTGKVYASGSIAELEESLSELFDEKLRAQLSFNARELINEWTLEESAEKIINAWKQAQVK